MTSTKESVEITPFPAASTASGVPVEQAIMTRRSIRSYQDTALTPGELGQLLWSAQGITDPNEGLRASPSAGAVYPLEMYVATIDGVFHYHAKEHALSTHLDEDVRAQLRKASLDQEMVEKAPAIFVFASYNDRMIAKYGAEWAEQYILLEVGHVAQNMLIQAESMGLAGVPVAAYSEEQVADILKLPDNPRIYYLQPMGHPAA
jgi:SagB-type dehydrogenase family enzyme